MQFFKDKIHAKLKLTKIILLKMLKWMLHFPQYQFIWIFRTIKKDDYCVFTVTVQHTVYDTTWECVCVKFFMGVNMHGKGRKQQCIGGLGSYK